MNRFQHLIDILIGLLTIAGGVLIIVRPDTGYLLVASIVSISFVVQGVRFLVFYFMMARYMVGGQMVLFLGVIAIDLGVMLYTFSDVPRTYIMLYLLGLHGFSGVMGILRVREARRYGSPSWRFSLFQASFNLAIAILALAFIRSPQIMCYIYGSGMIYSAIFRVISALRKTAVVYIQ